MRGVEEILIACVDGLTGFPEAIEVEYPKAKIQLCIVHMVRNSLRNVSWNDYKKVTKDLKKIYRSATEEEALRELENFGETWDQKHPRISQSWHRHWPNLITLFDYPEDIRKAIYTTNAIESLNSVIRKATKKRKVFPNDNAALKVVFLANEAASKKWTMPIRNWIRKRNEPLPYPVRRTAGAVCLEKSVYTENVTGLCLFRHIEDPVLEKKDRIFILSLLLSGIFKPSATGRLNSEFRPPHFGFGDVLVASLKLSISLFPKLRSFGCRRVPQYQLVTLTEKPGKRGFL